MSKFNKTVLIFSVACLFFFSLFVMRADAATLYLVPETRSLKIGQDLSVYVRVETDNVNINAVQAIITFSNDILEVVSADKVGSVFNFWVEEPVISNENGTVRFIGGTTKGVAGESLQILKLNFKTVGSGTGNISATEAVVTASDGKGTNVLSEISGTNVVVGTEVTAPEPLPIPTPAAPTPEPTEMPERVVREPVAAKNLPQAPEARVPLYPDQTKWYNHIGEAIMLWELPEDVVQIATRLSRSKDQTRGDIEEELYTGKNFGILDEGEWYIRIQFRNNLGWGEAIRYRIGIDLNPPLPFEIEMDAMATDNPAPEIRFETQDSLSGVSRSLIYIDDKEPIETTESVLTLPLQKPGAHTLTVRIFDNAGNSVEDSLEFEIMPLQTPVIDFITDSVAQDKPVFISGRSIPNGFADVKILDDKGLEIFSGSAVSGSEGHWELAIEQTLPRGKHSVIVVSRDERGALSYPTEPVTVKITARSVLSVGFIDLSWMEIILIIILIVIPAGGVLTWHYTSIKKKREAYRIIIGRDVVKLSDLLTSQLKKMESWLESDQFTPTAKAKGRTFIAKMSETIARVKKYLGEEITRLK